MIAYLAPIAMVAMGVVLMVSVALTTGSTQAIASAHSTSFQAMSVTYG